MKEKYTENVGYFKALADTNRLMIVDMLSCGELCACKILEKFAITQPTLSHHMKILCDCGLVKARKDGKWSYYSLDDEAVQAFKTFLCAVTSNTENCICKEGGCIYEGSAEKFETRCPPPPRGRAEQTSHREAAEGNGEGSTG